jgi:hypothetical protein
VKESKEAKMSKRGKAKKDAVKKTSSHHEERSSSESELGTSSGGEECSDMNSTDRDEACASSEDGVDEESKATNGQDSFSFDLNIIHSNTPISPLRLHESVSGDVFDQAPQLPEANQRRRGNRHRTSVRNISEEGLPLRRDQGQRRGRRASNDHGISPSEQNAGRRPFSTRNTESRRSRSSGRNRQIRSQSPSRRRADSKDRPKHGSKKVGLSQSEHQSNSRSDRPRGERIQRRRSGDARPLRSEGKESNSKRSSRRLRPASNKKSAEKEGERVKRSPLSPSYQSSNEDLAEDEVKTYATVSDSKLEKDVSVHEEPSEETNSVAEAKDPRNPAEASSPAEEDEIDEFKTTEASYQMGTQGGGEMVQLHVGNEVEMMLAQLQLGHEKESLNQSVSDDESTSEPETTDEANLAEKKKSSTSFRGLSRRIMGQSSSISNLASKVASKTRNIVSGKKSEKQFLDHERPMQSLSESKESSYCDESESKVESKMAQDSKSNLEKKKGAARRVFGKSPSLSNFASKALTYVSTKKVEKQECGLLDASITDGFADFSPEMLGEPSITSPASKIVGKNRKADRAETSRASFEAVFGSFPINQDKNTKAELSTETVPPAAEEISKAAKQELYADDFIKVAQCTEEDLKALSGTPHREASMKERGRKLISFKQQYPEDSDGDDRSLDPVLKRRIDSRGTVNGDNSRCTSPAPSKWDSLRENATDNTKGVGVVKSDGSDKGSSKWDALRMQKRVGAVASDSNGQGRDKASKSISKWGALRGGADFINMTKKRVAGDTRKLENSVTKDSEEKVAAGDIKCLAPSENEGASTLSSSADEGAETAEKVQDGDSKLSRSTSPRGSPQKKSWDGLRGATAFLKETKRKTKSSSSCRKSKDPSSNGSRPKSSKWDGLRCKIGSSAGEATEIDCAEAADCDRTSSEVDFAMDTKKTVAKSSSASKSRIDVKSLKDDSPTNLGNDVVASSKHPKKWDVLRGKISAVGEKYGEETVPDFETKIEIEVSVGQRSLSIRTSSEGGSCSEKATIKKDAMAAGDDDSGDVSTRRKWAGLRGELGSTNKSDGETTRPEGASASKIESTTTKNNFSGERLPTRKSRRGVESSKEDAPNSVVQSSLFGQEKWDRLKGANVFMKETKRKTSASDRKSSSRERDRDRDRDRDRNRDRDRRSSRSLIYEDSKPSSSKWDGLRSKLRSPTGETKEGDSESKNEQTASEVDSAIDTEPLGKSMIDDESFKKDAAPTAEGDGADNLNVRNTWDGLKGADTFIKETKRRVRSSLSDRKLSLRDRDRDRKSSRSRTSEDSKPSSSKWDGLRSKLCSSTGQTKESDSESKNEQPASDLDYSIDPEPLGKSAIETKSSRVASKEDSGSTAGGDGEDNLNVRKTWDGMKGADIFIKEAKRRARSSSSDRKSSLRDRDRDRKSSRSCTSEDSKPSSSKWDGLRSKLCSSTGQTKESDSERNTADREQIASDVDCAIDPEPLGKSTIEAKSSKEDSAPTAGGDEADDLNVRMTWDGLKGADTFIKETKRRARSSTSDRKSSLRDGDWDRKIRSRTAEESRPSSSKWASLRGKIGGSTDERKQGAHDSKSDLSTKTEKLGADPSPAPSTKSRNESESPKDGFRDGQSSDGVDIPDSLNGANALMKETKSKTSSSDPKSSSRDRDRDRDRKSSRSRTSGDPRSSSSKLDGLRGKLGSATGETKEAIGESNTNDRDQESVNLKSAIDTEKPIAEHSTLSKSAIDSESSKENGAASSAEGGLNVRRKWDGLKGANAFIKETKRETKSSRSDRKSTSRDRKSKSSGESTRGLGGRTSNREAPNGLDNADQGTGSVRAEGRVKSRGTKKTDVSETVLISKSPKARNKAKSSKWAALSGKIETKIRAEETKCEEETANQRIEVSPIGDAIEGNSKHTDDADSCRSDRDGISNSVDPSTGVGKKSSTWKLLKNGISFIVHTKKQAETNDKLATQTEDCNLIYEAQKHAEVFKRPKRSTNERVTDGDTAATESDTSARGQKR